MKYTTEQSTECTYVQLKTRRFRVMFYLLGCLKKVRLHFTSLMLQ